MWPLRNVIIVKIRHDLVRFPVPLELSECNSQLGNLTWQNVTDLAFNFHFWFENVMSIRPNWTLFNLENLRFKFKARHLCCLYRMYAGSRDVNGLNGVSEQCSVYYARPPGWVGLPSPRNDSDRGFLPGCGRSDQATKRNEAEICIWCRSGCNVKNKFRSFNHQIQANERLNEMKNAKSRTNQTSMDHKAM